MTKPSGDQTSRSTQSLTKSDLAHFTGTEQIYRHWLVRQVLYTDGVQYVAEAGHAYWLLDKIACSQLETHIARHVFQLWTLAVREDRSADLVCTDGDGTLIVSERIRFTDFPLSEIKLYVTNSTILLPSEY